MSLARSGIRVQLLPRDEAGDEGRKKHASHGNYMYVGVEEGQRAWSRDSAQGILGKSKGGRNAGQRTEAATRCECGGGVNGNRDLPFGKRRERAGEGRKAWLKAWGMISLSVVGWMKEREEKGERKQHK